eukprot:TRINITY_DN41263_c0_g2_i1.p1 TRINITY_DN41263_c0_g2~~TRINITY_DN41263_c0_g2_i1.p1  ORF type:complete len:139 (+),score=15.87 TRINITY_DN41263_c0_g2_i1:39-455(+)
MKKIYGILGLGLFLTIGLTMQFTGMGIWASEGGFWGLFAVLCYLFAPLPSLFGGVLQQKDTFSPLSVNKGKTWSDIGIFLSSMFLSSGLLMPLVFYNTGVINLPTMILIECGGIIVYSSIVAYMFFFMSPPKKDDLGF